MFSVVSNSGSRLWGQFAEADLLRFDRLAGDIAQVERDDWVGQRPVPPIRARREFLVHEVTHRHHLHRGGNGADAR